MLNLKLSIIFRGILVIKCAHCKQIHKYLQGAPGHTRCGWCDYMVPLLHTVTEKKSLVKDTLNDNAEAMHN